MLRSICQKLYYLSQSLLWEGKIKYEKGLEHKFEKSDLGQPNTIYTFVKPNN